MGPRPTVRPRLRLLYVGDADLARQCLGRPGGSIEVVEASRPVADPVSPLPFDILLIEHGQSGVDALAVLSDLRSRKLHLPVVIVAEWNEDLAAKALALGASDYVTKSTASFRAIYFRLHRLRAHAALLAEHGRIKDPQTAAVDRSGPGRDELTRQVSEHQAAREQAEHRLREAVATIQRVREGRFADAIAAAKELANRESAFAAKVQAAETTIGSLEQRLADREVALRDTEARAASEGAATENAARRQ